MRTDRHTDVTKIIVAFLQILRKSIKIEKAVSFKTAVTFCLITVPHSAKTILVSEILFSSSITHGCDVTSLNCLQYVTDFKKDERRLRKGN